MIESSKAPPLTNGCAACGIFAPVRVLWRASIVLACGNPGDIKPVGEGLSEQVNYGPGYRVYFLRRGALVVVLLCGGDKSTQDKDITHAKTIAVQWQE